MTEKIDIKELIDAGVHFGHITRKWDPNMAPYIYTERTGIHIIDMYKTAAKIEEAAELLEPEDELTDITKEFLGKVEKDAVPEKEVSEEYTKKIIATTKKHFEKYSNKKITLKELDKVCGI